MTSGRDRYAAERARQIKAQGRRRPADPQQQPARQRPSTATALPCATPVSDADPWRVCGDPQLSHWETRGGNVTWCSISTAAGRCGCEKFTGQHVFGPAGVAVICQWCGVYFLDAVGPCGGRQ